MAFYSSSMFIGPRWLAVLCSGSRFAEKFTNSLVFIDLMQGKQDKPRRDSSAQRCSRHAKRFSTGIAAHVVLHGFYFLHFWCAILGAPYWFTHFSFIDGKISDMDEDHALKERLGIIILSSKHCLAFFLSIAVPPFCRCSVQKQCR